MEMLVQDVLFARPDSTHPLVNGQITVTATARPLWAKIGGVLREVLTPFKVFADPTGAVSFYLPWPSESDPATVNWQITFPDGSTISGPSLDGNTGPIGFEALKNSPGWGVVSTPLAPVVTVQGPAGKAGVGARTSKTFTGSFGESAGTFTAVDSASITTTGGDLMVIVNGAAFINVNASDWAEGFFRMKLGGVVKLQTAVGAQRADQVGAAQNLGSFTMSKLFTGLTAGTYTIAVEGRYDNTNSGASGSVSIDGTSPGGTAGYLEIQLVELPQP